MILGFFRNELFPQIRIHWCVDDWRENKGTWGTEVVHGVLGQLKSAVKKTSGTFIVPRSWTFSKIMYSFMFWRRKCIKDKLCAWRHMPRSARCAYARCGPPPVHSLHALRLGRPANLALWIFMIDRQRLALGGGVETGLVDIHYVMTTKAAWWPWPVTFWPWNWCPSHGWRGLTLCQFWSS